MKFTEIITEGEKGLWANIHAKRARIKRGSGEKMRKPGSKGAPSAQNFKDAATEDANPKRQAAIAIAKKEQGMAEGEVIPMQPRNPLNKNLIIQLKALSETALEIFWEGSYMPTAAQGQMAQLSQQEQTKIFNQNVAQFKALGYEPAIFEDDMDILFLHSIAREAWYDSKKPMSKYRGLPDLEYNSDTNSLKIIDLIGDDDKGIVYDKNVYEQDVTEGSQRVDSLVTDALKIMKGPEIRDAILALKTVLGDREYNDRRGHYNFYVKQMLDMYGQQGLAEAKDPWKDYEFIHNGQKIGHIYSQTGQPPFTTRRKVGKFIKQMKHNSLKDAQTYLINRSLGRPMYQDMSIDEDWQKVNKSDKTDGMSSKAVKSYRRENPGSKLKTAVTTKPSKLKKGSKAANRRKSFCARMGGMKKAHASAKTKRDPDSPINKALRRWNCESIQQMQELVMIAEQKIRNLKK